MDQPLTPRQELEQVLAAEQQLRDSSQPPDVELVLKRAFLLTDLSRLHEALSASDEAGRIIEQEALPPNIELHRVRGRILNLLGRNDEALSTLDEIERIHAEQGKPLNPGFYNNRALMISDQGRYQEALATIEEGMEKFAELDLPVPHIMHWNRGNMLQMLDRYEEALEAYDRFETEHLAQGQAAIYAIEVGRARILGKAGQYEESLAAYSRAVKLIEKQGLGEDWRLFFARAVTHFEAGNREEAINDLYRTIATCGRLGIVQPAFVTETLQDWLSPKPEKLVEEQIASQPVAVQPVPDSEKLHDVFICYRRDPGHTHSMLLQAHMEMKGKTVFRDQDGLASGRFEDDLREAIRYSRHMVILLTAGFFDRCCHDEGDVVRKEIATALHYGTHIIPVKMEGFSWPASAVLPEDISDICGINAMSHSAEFYTAFIDKLLKWME